MGRACGKHSGANAVVVGWVDLFFTKNQPTQPTTSALAPECFPQALPKSCPSSDNELDSLPRASIWHRFGANPLVVEAWAFQKLGACTFTIRMDLGSLMYAFFTIRMNMGNLIYSFFAFKAIWVPSECGLWRSSSASPAPPLSAFPYCVHGRPRAPRDSAASLARWSQSQFGLYFWREPAAAEDRGAANPGSH